jgi:hypothetical protein
MDFKKSYRIVTLGPWIGLGIAFLFGIAFKILWLAYIGIIIMFASYIQAFFFLKCPHCGRSIDPRGGLKNYCPHCGHTLEW